MEKIDWDKFQADRDEHREMLASMMNGVHPSYVILILADAMNDYARKIQKNDHCTSDLSRAVEFQKWNEKLCELLGASPIKLPKI